MSDKARQIKERTLAMEVKHAQMTGGTFRDAETANMRNLERLAARQREGRKPAPKSTRPRDFAHREITKKDLAGENVTRKPAPPKKLIMPPCQMCGRCLWCKRYQRSRLIMRKAGESALLLSLTMELVGMSLAAQQRSDFRDNLGREYPFSRLRRRDADRAVTAGIENICDRSIPYLGAWR